MKKIVFSLALICMSSCVLAYNGLGNPAHNTVKVASIKTKTTSINDYNIITTEQDGITVNEYINSQNIVFAVTWRGQFLPDFSTLLGQYSNSVQGNSGKIEHRQFHQDNNNLVVSKSYHDRIKSGFAYLKDELPQNFLLTDLNQ